MRKILENKLVTNILKGSFAFFIVLIILRLISYFYLSVFQNNSDILSYRGLLNDLSFTCRLFLIIGLFQAFINWILKRNLSFLLYTFPILFIWIELALIEYLKTTTIKLDEALFNYSFNEVLIISGGGASLNLFLIVCILFFPLLYILLFQKTTFFKPTNQSVKYGILCFVISLFIPSITNSNNERFNQLVNNNTAYFLSRIYAYYQNESHHSKENFKPLTAQDYKLIDPNFFGGKPLNVQYPFYHELSEKSEFANYLKPTSNGKSPNIVFIICESLSTYFVADKANKTGHIMPFLDSLAKQSLYWPNFMSVCDRTYHALPGGLASIPIIPGGKIFHEMENPSYYSLMNLLDKSYFSRFYCGTYLSFTQMDSYMNNNNTSYLVKDWESSLSNKIDGEVNPWGYQEKEVFLKSWLDYNKQNLANKPRLDIFLTVSTHPPYKLMEKEKYLQKTKSLILQNGKKQNINYDYVLKNHLDAYSTYTYLDDQIRTYLSQAKNQPNYENTIFIIYGDHGTGIASSDDISEYKIPLIIYSPLLKQPEKFLGVSSQLDLTPTLINYLKTTYIPTLPTQVTFAGKELSYSKKYTNDRTLLFGTYLRNQDYFLDRDYFIRNGQLYEVGDNLNVQKTTNLTKFNSLEKQKEQAKKIINYAIYNDKLGPKDSISKYITNYNQNLINIFKKEAVVTQKEGNNIEFLDLGEFITIDSKTQQLILKFSIDFLSKNQLTFDEIPKLTLSIHDEKGNDIYWSQVDYFQDNALTTKKWNTLISNKTINISELIKGKQTGKKLLVKYYLLNGTKQKYELRNSKISFYSKASK
jgi:uncharacterized sulfatase